MFNTVIPLIHPDRCPPKKGGDLQPRHQRIAKGTLLEKQRTLKYKQGPQQDSVVKFSDNTFTWFLLLIFTGIGFLGALYYVEHETRFGSQRYSTEEILRTRVLSNRLRNLEYQNAHLESEIAELNLKTAEYYQHLSYKKAQELARFIGLIQQEGPGINIHLKDSSKPLLLGDNPNTGIIHNTDLVQIVNELHSAGASFIAINNHPVVGSTAISCSGPIILINGSRVASPFTISALGDPEKLMDATQKPSSFLKELQSYGITAQVSKADVIIPAYSQKSPTL